MKKLLFACYIVFRMLLFVHPSPDLTNNFINTEHSHEIFTDFKFIEQTFSECFPGQARGPVWNSYGNENRGTHPRWQGVFESQPIQLGSQVAIFMTGYPKFSCSFTIKEVASEDTLTLHFRNNPPFRQWEKYVWNIPKNWVGRKVVYVLKDTSDRPFYGWFGFALAASTHDQFDAPKLNLNQAASLLAIAFQMVLYLLPGLAFWQYLKGRSNLHRNLELPLILVTSSLAGYLGFYLYLISSESGKLYSLAFSLVSVWYFCSQKSSFKIPQRILEPLSIILLVALFQWSSALLILSNDSVYELTKARFFGSIAPDSRIPNLFANKLYFEQSLRPFLLDWLSSDRPPLQTGSYLVQMPFLSYSFPQYFVLGTVLQSTVFAGAFYALSRIFRNRKLMVICLSLMIFSGITIQNVFYAWPKLYSTCFIFLLVGLVFEKRPFRYSSFNETLKWVLVTLCAALALLAHGAGLFALLPLLVLFLLRRNYPSWKHFAIAIAVFSITYGPWIAYQKLVDPPGDRLLKWHFAGQPDVTDESALETISKAYQSVSLNQWLAMRWQNIEILFQDAERFADLLSLKHYQSGFESFKQRSYWSFFLIQGPVSWFCVALPFLIWRGGATRQRILSTLFIFFLGLFFWINLLFAGGSTTPHHGSYFFNYLIWVTSGFVIYRFGLTCALAILSINALFICAVWIYPPFNFGFADTIYSQSPLSLVMLLVNWITFCLWITWIVLNLKPLLGTSLCQKTTPSLGSGRELMRSKEKHSLR